MSVEEVKVYFVRKKAKEEIPKNIKVYDCLKGGFSEEFEWSKNFSTYKLEAIEQEDSEWLKVTYRLVSKDI